MSEKKAQLSIDGIDESIDLPVYKGSTGPDVVDVRGLVSKGVFTYDPGFVSTAACESEITYIDGAAGVLLHRGYPIEQLAEKSDFLETCYLLLNGAAHLKHMILNIFQLGIELLRYVLAMAFGLRVHLLFLTNLT